MSELLAGHPWRVFVAGGSGALGKALIPKLVARGHEVTAMARSVDTADELRRMGATPALADVFETERLRRTVADARPDVVINQLSSCRRAP